MVNRRNLLAALGAAGITESALAATGSDGGEKSLNVPILFIQQDTVLSFPPTGDGVRVGSAVGRLSGTTIQMFQFLPVAPPEFKADDRMCLSDVDGDQILFRVQVTGRFLFPFGESVKAGESVFGVGGPFTGVYEVTNATGKYRYLIGRKFPCRGLGSNPGRPGFLGTVYVEVYTDRFEDRGSI